LSKQLPILNSTVEVRQKCKGAGGGLTYDDYAAIIMY